MPRPSPAMVIATIALVVAMAGGAYAALKAPKNSVVSRSIKNGQVKRPDIAARAVNGAKVADGSLSAADLAAAAFEPEAVHRIAVNPGGVDDPCATGQTGVYCGQELGPPPTGHWSDPGGGYEPAGYYRDRSGLVHLVGSVRVNTPNATSTIVVLPVGYRPAAKRLYDTVCFQGTSIDAYNEPPGGFQCAVTVAPDGRVRHQYGGYPNAGMTLESISFRAAG